MILVLIIILIIKTPGLGRMLGRERMLPRRHTDHRMQQRQEEEMLEREHLRGTRAAAWDGCRAWHDVRARPGSEGQGRRVRSRAWNL